MGKRVVVYGATGRYGREIALALIRAGLTPVLAARDGSLVRDVAKEMGAEAFTCSVEDPDVMSGVLGRDTVLLNCAGPFAATAVSLATACIRAGASYLDLGGEVEPLVNLQALDAVAKAAQVTLLPAVGYTSAATDCLAVIAHRRWPGADHLAIGLAGAEVTSRGSVRTMVAQAGSVIVRRDGKLTRLAPGALVHSLDYGSEPAESVAFSLGDVVTAFHSTAIPNIAVFLQATARVRGWARLHTLAAPLMRAPGARAMAEAAADLFPSAASMPGGEAIAVAEVSGPRESRTLRLLTPDVHTFTVRAAVDVVRRLAENGAPAGFQTPATAFGEDLALQLGSRLELPD